MGILVKALFGCKLQKHNSSQVVQKKDITGSCNWEFRAVKCYSIYFFSHLAHAFTPLSSVWLSSDFMLTSQQQENSPTFPETTGLIFTPTSLDKSQKHGDYGGLSDQTRPWSPLRPRSCRLWVFSHDWLFATLWTAACQSPLSMEFSRQEHWSELPFPTPGDLPYPAIEPESLASHALAGEFFTTALPEEPRSIT